MKRFKPLAILAFGGMNAGALALGGYFTGPGVTSTWYTELNQAPWIPPGPVFGIAWTLVMVGLTLFMAKRREPAVQRKLLPWYAIQWLLNVAWNPLFFAFKRPDWALFDMVLLFACVLMLWRHAKIQAWWLIPYIAWLMVATSLNVWVVLFNA